MLAILDNSLCVVRGWVCNRRAHNGVCCPLPGGLQRCSLPPSHRPYIFVVRSVSDAVCGGLAPLSVAYCCEVCVNVAVRFRAKKGGLANDIMIGICSKLNGILPESLSQRKKSGDRDSVHAIVGTWVSSPSLLVPNAEHITAVGCPTIKTVTGGPKRRLLPPGGHLFVTAMPHSPKT